jgi:diacylglycerol kinase (ATP)
MAYSGNTGLTRIIKAAGYSWQGIKDAYKYEAAFRQETWLALVLIPLAIYVAETATQLAFMISSVLLVMLVEILNSAVEAVVDRFGDELHELSGRAKDMASAAVTFSLIIMALIWGLMLWEIFS